jgi:hypothetical protein
VRDNKYKILFTIPDGEDHFGDPGLDVRILKRILNTWGGKGVDSIHLPQNTVQWWGLINTLINRNHLVVVH